MDFLVQMVPEKYPYEINLYADPATDGFVLFDGEDIRMHRSNFLDRLGYMPQHSCLYPDFTVQEYLYYVGALKGMHKKM